jgi:hypothetical protein
LLVASPLVRWLATLDAGELEAILTRRPDTMAAPAVTSLAELAGRLQDGV